MSYDIYMLRLSGMRNRAEEVRALLERRARAEELGEEPAPSAAADERRRALADDLVKLHPSLTMSPGDRGFSHGCEIVADDPDCHMPYIWLEVEDALVSFSYAADASAVFSELQRVIGVFERHGYAAFDRQSETILASRSIPSAAAFHTTINEVVRQAGARGETVIPLGAQRPKTSNVLIVAAAIVVALLFVGRYVWGGATSSGVPVPALTEHWDELARQLKRFKAPPPEQPDPAVPTRSGVPGPR